ncbi:galactokinase [Pseudoclavibacter sp. AY1H1]|uniref:galactokinase n=1 Tax=Pseudoclavibacter sp. AY1H1 TaxID=2080584 RepID=UPI000CE81774|nr:galactokinase [Pseudoclavibacter sp. AY1H1]PPF35347.1 galactokinase [Pseudoclavibacter sp. AY1H1]
MTRPELATTAAEAFARIHGGAPDGLWSSPGRVNLIGEHTDYNEGFVFPFAIDRHTVVAARLRDDRLVRVSSGLREGVEEIGIDELAPDALGGWSAYALGVIWAAGELGADLSEVRGLDLHIESDVPLGAGLSSSAALEGAVAVAIDELWGLGLDRRTLARVGRLAENEAVGAPTGIMDQSAVLLGQRDSGVLLDCRSLESRIVPLAFEAQGLALLVIDTRVEHSHASGGYTERRASCEKGAAGLGVASLRDVTVGDLERAERVLDDETFRRVRHIVTENARVLAVVAALGDSGPRSLGPLLAESHASMRDDFEISVPELDLAVSTAVAAGAIGSRMTGGGFGGAAIALVERGDLAEVSRSIHEAFAAAGFAEPATFEVLPSQGAGRV